MSNTEISLEKATKKRISEMQNELNDYAKSRNEDVVRFLSLRLDVQLKLEDYRVKFREAQHAKMKVWGPLFLPVVLSLISLIIGLIVAFGAHHQITNK